MTTTITRLFDNYADAEAAVRDLESLGVPHADVSLASNDHDRVGAHRERSGDAESVNHAGDVTRGTTTGAAIGGVGGLLAGLGLLAIPGIGPVVAAGWLATTLAGAGLGAAGGAATGTIVGAVSGAGPSDDDAHVYAEGVRRGSTLVSARVSNSMADEAEAVFHRHSGVSAATRGQAYRQSGWSRYDETAPAYTRDEMARERTLYANDMRV